MKLKNFTMVNNLNVLNGFTNKKFPQKISYAITKDIILLQKEYQCYSEALNKLIAKYDNDIVRDEKGNMMSGDSGIPIIKNEAASKSMNAELDELLNIEVEVNPHYIPDSAFDYDDGSGHYDTMLPSEIMALQAILCNGGDKEAHE